MLNNLISLVIIISFFDASSLFYHTQTDDFKNEAKKEMITGRYGEAIELLNHYISARPQEADGNNLRGLCNEKHGQYELAIYDLRSAPKLQSDNFEINQNLSRSTDAWYKQLYNKIEGHKREIAVNPKHSVNYFEIGRSYKNIGQWLSAEDWYDKYLSMEAASPDEIIRYTEILAKNNHIQKGEPILKRYTERFPTDQRLLSRYGYYEMWLGKMVYLNAGKSYFTEADHYLSLAQKISPDNTEVEGTGNFLNSWKQTEGERELYRKRGEVAKLLEAGDYLGADAKYDEIMITLNNPEKNILLEYAYVTTNAKRYDKAYADVVYNPFPSFIILGRVTIGSTYRFDSSYNSISASLSAYWSC